MLNLGHFFMWEHCIPGYRRLFKPRCRCTIMKNYFFFKGPSLGPHFSCLPPHVIICELKLHTTLSSSIFPSDSFVVITATSFFLG